MRPIKIIIMILVFHSTLLPVAALECQLVCGQLPLPSEPEGGPYVWSEKILDQCGLDLECVIDFEVIQPDKLICEAQGDLGKTINGECESKRNI